MFFYQLSLDKKNQPVYISMKYEQYLMNDLLINILVNNNLLSSKMFTIYIRR